MKWPKLKRDYPGLRVQTLRELKTGFCSVPEGSLATITYCHGGANLTVDPCPSCGVKVYVRKVPLSALALLGKEVKDV